MTTVEQTYVTIPEQLARAIGDHFSQYRDTNDVPRALLEVLVPFFREGDEDDPSVGIFSNGGCELAFECERALRGMMRCHGCNGEGFQWSEKDDTMDKCSVCGSSGEVPIAGALR